MERLASVREGGEWSCYLAFVVARAMRCEFVRYCCDGEDLVDRQVCGVYDTRWAATVVVITDRPPNH